MRLLDVAQAVGALAFVLGLMWFLARLSRRTLGSRGAGVLDVVARQPLTRGAAVAVVRVADRTLVLGVTEQHVSLLGEADPAAIADALAASEQTRVQARVPATGTAAPGWRPDGSANVPAGGRMSGSVLSPQTWRQTVEFLRARTARRR